MSLRMMSKIQRCLSPLEGKGTNVNLSSMASVLKHKSVLFLEKIQKPVIQTLQTELKNMTFASSGRLIIQHNVL